MPQDLQPKYCKSKLQLHGKDGQQLSRDIIERLSATTSKIQKRDVIAEMKIMSPQKQTFIDQPRLQSLCFC